MLRALASLVWNADERRVRALYRVVAQFALRAGALAGLSTLLGAVAVARGHLPAGTSWLFVLMRWAPEQLAYRVAGLAVEPRAALVSAAIAMRWLDRRSVRSIGFRFDRAWWRDYAFGLALGVGLIAAIFGIGVAAGWLVVTGTLDNPHPWSLGTALALALAWNIGNGFEEELADRAYLLRNAAEGSRTRRVGPRAALVMAYVLSSSLFGLAHFSGPHATWTAVVNLMVVGAFFGLSYVLTGELALAMGAHATWNFAQSNLFGLATSGHEASATLLRVQQSPGAARWLGHPEFGPEGGLLCLLVCALGGVATVAWVRRTRGEVRLRTDW